jgi:hypothetical protein
MSTDSQFWGFCTVCKISLPMMFQEPPWVPSSMVIGWSVLTLMLENEIRAYQSFVSVRNITGRGYVSDKLI